MTHVAQADTLTARPEEAPKLAMRFPLTRFGRREYLLHGGLSLGLLVLISGAASLLHLPWLVPFAVLPLAGLIFTLPR